MAPENGLYRLVRIVWYLFFLVEAILALRFLLRLLGANPAAGFTDFIYSLSALPLAPFRLVFDSSVITAGSVVEWSTLLAMAVYWVVAWGIVKLIAMQRPVGRIEARRELEIEDNA